MKFFFPDSHDLVDPTFDFKTERRSYSGSRQQAQQYAHEVLEDPPYHGMLVSKAVVDGHSKNVRYSFSQVQRLKRLGIREFLRLDRPGIEGQIRTMGDCGSFTYVNEEIPPFTVPDVIEFYLDCKFDFGVSLDHVVFGFSAQETVESSVLEEWTRRSKLTEEYAFQFIQLQRENRLPFTPLGVAQGWSPESYRKAVVNLQKMGFDYIALGGMVPLKSTEILECLAAIRPIRKPETKLHLLGIGRFDKPGDLTDFGVHSFDSTAPLKQAFMDDRDNYYTPDSAYTAVRIPQVGENAKLKKRILSGEIDHNRARELESSCLQGILAYAEESLSLESLLDRLREYELLWHGKKDETERYRQTLKDQPWRKCSCSVCKAIGIHVIIFRGAERNRRRGFHNLQVVRTRLENGSTY